MRVLLCHLEASDTEIVAALPKDVVIFYTADAEDMLECACDCLPDVVLMDSAMPDLMSALVKLNDMLPLPVVLIARDESALPAEFAPNVYGMLVRPISADAARLTLDTSCRLFLRVQQLRREITALQDAFAARKIIERAKGLIMQRRMMTEAEAYRIMREESRRQRITIAEFAASMLEGNSPSPANFGGSRLKKEA